jgi:hypothetical protein
MVKQSFKILALMLGMLAGSTLVSCGDDDPTDPGDNTDNQQYVDLTYHIELSQPWYDFFDIVATYTDIAGENHTDTIKSNWEYQIWDNAEQAGTSFAIDVKATPKEYAPEVEEGVVYTLSDSSYMTVSVSDQSGKKLKTFSESSAIGTKSVGGDNARAFFGKSHQLLNKSWSR